jgi:hypothetical protein
MVVRFSHLDTIITTVPYRAGDIPLRSAGHNTLVDTSLLTSGELSHLVAPIYLYTYHATTSTTMTATSNLPVIPVVSRHKYSYTDSYSYRGVQIGYSSNIS